MFGIVVDTADNQRGAVFLGDGRDRRETFFAILEIDGVDDAFALTLPQRGLHDLGVHGVDHDGHLDLAGQAFEKLVHILQFVAVGIGETGVDDMRAVANLLAGDFGGLFVFALGDEAFEFTAADDIGALADHNGPFFRRNFKIFDAGDMESRGALRIARPAIRDGFGDGFDILGRRSAASAEDIDPAVLREASENGGDIPGRFVVTAFFIRQTGVGHAADMGPCDIREGADMIGHEAGAGGAVEADGEQVNVFEGCVERLDALPGQHCAHGFDGAADHNGQVRAKFFLRLLESDNGGFQV